MPSIFILALTVVVAFWSNPVNCLIKRSTIDQHLHQYHILEFDSHPDNHLAKRHIEEIRPLTLLFAGKALTLDLSINHDYFDGVPSDITDEVDPSRFLAGQVRGREADSWVRLFIYDGGIEGVIMLHKGLGDAEEVKYRIEVIMEEDGTLTGEHIIFRNSDMKKQPKLSQHRCGHEDMPFEQLSDDDNNVVGEIANDSIPWRHTKPGPTNETFIGHSSLDVLEQLSSIHLTSSESRPLSSFVLSKRATTTYKYANIGCIHDPTLNSNSKTARLWIAARMAIVSALYERSFNVVLRCTKFQRVNIKGNSGDDVLDNMGRVARTTPFKGTDVAIVHGFTRQNFGMLLGIAMIDTVCDADKHGFSIARMDDDSYEVTIAHELAHNFGVAHDTTRPCNVDKNIMNPILTGNIYTVSWSSCSRRQFSSHINSYKCLLKGGAPAKKASSVAAESEAATAQSKASTSTTKKIVRKRRKKVVVKPKMHATQSKDNADYSMGSS